jgi:hypothetical protein
MHEPVGVPGDRNTKKKAITVIAIRTDVLGR